MKSRTLLSVLALGFIISAIGQKSTIELSFTAENNGQHIPLDSIFIKNLTQDGDTTLYAPDTLLVLDYITSIHNYRIWDRNTFFISQNYPNPFKGKTYFDLYIMEHDEINIIIQDILGKELVHYKKDLKPGIHSFAFYSAKEKYYLLNVTRKQNSQSIKMMNTNTNSFYRDHCEIVYIENSRNNIDFKSIYSKSDFVFNMGDELEYTAFSGMGEVSMIDTPEENQIYTFQFAGIPCSGIPTITDIEGNEYNTVLIGSQCWMKENLKTTLFSNGVPIPHEPDSSIWWNLWTSAYVWYNNDSLWKDPYGALYNWWAANDTSGLCPTGWHVPTHEEWTILTDFIGGENSPHGSELKSCRQVNSPMGGDCNTTEHPRWDESNSDWGTDNYGFSGMPGGFRDINGDFNYLGTYGLWWTATQSSGTSAWHRGLNLNTGAIYLSTWSKRNGFSVRCIRND